MSEKVSQREFARRVGRSHAWINELVRNGRIPADSRGRISFAEGLEAFEASQTPGFDEARERAEKKRQEIAAAKGKPSAPKKASTVKKAPSRRKTEPKDSDLPDEGIAQLTTAEVNAAFNRYKLAEKKYQAKLRGLEYKEATGQLIPVEQVHEDARNAGVEVRERLMAVPPRVAGLCEGKPAREIERIVEEAINEALSALQRSRFGKDGK